MNPPEPSCQIPEEHYTLFLRNELERASRIELMEHLLSGCARCRAAVPRFGGLRIDRSEGGNGTNEEARDRQRDFVRRLSDQAALLDREHAATDKLLPEFLAHPLGRQRTILANQPQYATYSFVDRLLDASFRRIYSDPKRTEELVELASEQSDRLDESRYGERLLTDLRARVLGHRANVHRTFGRLPEARASLRAATELLQAGSLDPLSEAELLYFDSGLRFSERRPEDALRSVRRARAIYEQFGDDDQVGLCLNGESTLLELTGELEEARRLALEAIERIDPATAPELAAAARHNLIWRLIDLDRLDEAEARSVEFASFFEGLADGITSNKFEWRRAVLLDRRGQASEAEATYRRVLDRFLELDLPYEAAGVSLDLALVLLDQRRFAEVEELAIRTLAVFRGLGVEQESIAAWLVFKEAAEAETLSRALIERLSEFFSMAKVRPGEPFRR